MNGVLVAPFRLTWRQHSAMTSPHNLTLTLGIGTPKENLKHQCVYSIPLPFYTQYARMRLRTGLRITPMFGAQLWSAKHKF